MTSIAVLHPGEMGAGFGADLVAAGHDVGWLPAGRGDATAQRAAAAGLRTLDDVAGCEVVLSICPPDKAIDVARGIGAFTGVYVDCNAISPATAESVAAVVTEAGATYVDGGIVGGAPAPDMRCGFYLSGSGAVDVAQLFADTHVDARVLDGAGPYAASALKMSYAAWSKISQALVLAADGLATELGVGDALAAEWAMSHPYATERLEVARHAAATKGWRWTGEMREIARALADTGGPDGFGLAAAEIYARYSRP